MGKKRKHHLMTSEEMIGGLRTKVTTIFPDKKGWIPVRKGKIYCSPLCGGGCTVNEFEGARDAAFRVARKLGRGWRAVVWENLGWYWKVVAADEMIEVRPWGSEKRVPQYEAKISIDRRSYTGTGNNLKELVKRVFAIAVGNLRHMNALLNKIDASVKQ